jgi:hypothetical protein
MNDEIRKCLTKILVSIDSIGSYLINNRSFQVYQTNNALRLIPNYLFQIPAELLIPETGSFIRMML